MFYNTRKIVRDFKIAKCPGRSTKYRLLNFIEVTNLFILMFFATTCL